MWDLQTVSITLPSLMAVGIEEAQIQYLFHLSRDHIVKRSHDLEVGVPPSQVTSLPSLMTIDIVEVQI